MIYLVSAAGSPNLGDCGILLTWIREIRCHVPDEEIIVDCLNVANVRVLIDRSSFKNITVVDALWRATRYYGRLGLWEGQKRIRQDFVSRNPEYVQETWALPQYMGNCRILHILGGGFLAEQWETNLLFLPLLAAMKARYGYKWIATGMGLTISTPQVGFDLIPHIARIDYVSDRDSKSELILEEAGHLKCRGYDDLILALPAEPAVSEDNGSFEVCIQRDLFSAEAFGSSVRNAAKFLSKSGRRVTAWQMMPGSDDLSASYFEEIGLHVERRSYLDCLDLLMNCKTATWPRAPCLGSRYHFHLLNSWFGRSGQFISSGEYYDIKHEAVRDLGSNWTPFMSPIQAMPDIDRIGLVHHKKSEAAKIYSCTASSPSPNCTRTIPA